MLGTQDGDRSLEEVSAYGVIDPSDEVKPGLFTHEVAIGYVGVAVSECLVGGGAVACCDLVDRSTVTAAIGWSYLCGVSG
ncbi:hypothetical protein [Lacticaseibacillus pantheris]|uniref:hypothetical protein n=1 Tax=Lacticaseibacillus pantheris TaxID=171523 RepID=UPI002657EB2A|nr:hypothetical protein [Lacticaseibacillus pantheris]WKF85599.1 hypothetical protein QY874_03135 [Lacticaseibacillus pantheris]